MNTTEISELRPDDITDRQAAVAENMILNGMSKAEAIKAAGYASKAAGYNAIRNSRVREYMQALIREHILEGSIKAARVIEGLMDTSRSDYVKLEAAKDMLDRAGFKPVEKHAHVHAGTVNFNIDLG